MESIYFTRPFSLTSLFDVHVDETQWPEFRYLPESATPMRPRATFNTHARGMTPRAEHLDLLKGHGVYVMAFLKPYPAIYVGKAIGETFMSRLQKHRVKATGSHVGRTPEVHGAVSHPEGWQVFAKDRYECFGSIGVPDCLADAVVMLGTLGLSPDTIEFRDTCQQCESELVKDGPLRSQLIRAAIGLPAARRINTADVRPSAKTGILVHIHHASID